jgi:hypothetical protein
MPVPPTALWVVTSYYNPERYQRRFNNFKAFRKHLNAPLLVVELAKPGQHQLCKEDGDIVISLTGEDRIWQKERLLNIAIAELPPHVEYVAWVDCDVIFGDEEWPRQALARLAQNGGLLQLFDHSHHMPSDLDTASISPEACAQATPILTGVSIAFALRTSAFDTNEIKLTHARSAADPASYHEAVDRHNCYGMAWSARRQDIAACGHYDRNIIGGGDAVHVFAALSRLDDYWTLRANSEHQKRDIQAWTRSAREAGLLSNIDSLQQDVFHLWHGSLADRNYRGRYNILSRHDFDPARDLLIAGNGTWQWRDPVGDLAREVGSYFSSRQEDGKLSHA